MYLSSYLLKMSDYITLNASIGVANFVICYKSSCYLYTYCLKMLLYILLYLVDCIFVCLCVMFHLCVWLSIISPGLIDQSQLQELIICSEAKLKVSTPVNWLPWVWCFLQEVQAWRNIHSNHVTTLIFFFFFIYIYTYTHICIQMITHRHVSIHRDLRTFSSPPSH